MATYEMEIPDEKIQEMLQGDRGIAVLLEPILNQILQSEMTEHLGAERARRPLERVHDTVAQALPGASGPMLFQLRRRRSEREALRSNVSKVSKMGSTVMVRIEKRTLVPLEGGGRSTF